MLFLRLAAVLVNTPAPPALAVQLTLLVVAHSFPAAQSAAMEPPVVTALATPLDLALKAMAQAAAVQPVPSLELAELVDTALTAVTPTPQAAVAALAAPAAKVTAQTQPLLLTNTRTQQVQVAVQAAAVRTALTTTALIALSAVTVAWHRLS